LTGAMLPVFKDTMAQFYKLENETILLSLTHVIFMDQDTVQMLVEYIKRFQVNHHFVICGLTPPVKAIFASRHLEEQVLVYGREEDALAALNPEHAHEDTLRERLESQFGRLLKIFRKH